MAARLMAEHLIGSERAQHRANTRFYTRHSFAANLSQGGES